MGSGLAPIFKTIFGIFNDSTLKKSSNTMPEFFFIKLENLNLSACMLCVSLKNYIKMKYELDEGAF